MKLRCPQCGHMVARASIESLPDDDWDFIVAAVEAGWSSIRIWRDSPHLTFGQVQGATKIAREEMGLDGRKRNEQAKVA